MKKPFLVLGLFFLTNLLFAQNWLLGTDLIFTIDRTNPKSSESPDFTRFTLELYFGRYIAENLALGGEIGYYCYNLTDTSIKFGPFIEYDFMKLPYLYLGVKSSLDYRIYYNPVQKEYNGSSIDWGADLLLNFTITKNIVIFTSLVGGQFQYKWWAETISGTETNFSRTFFNIDGWAVLNNLKLGLKFKF